MFPVDDDLDPVQLFEILVSKCIHWPTLTQTVMTRSSTVHFSFTWSIPAIVLDGRFDRKYNVAIWRNGHTRSNNAGIH